MKMVTARTIELGKYMIAEIGIIEGRKTPIFKLFNKQDERIFLGEVKWNSGWRKYCFYPAEETLYDSICLLELVNFIDCTVIAAVNQLEREGVK